MNRKRLLLTIGLIFVTACAPAQLANTEIAPTIAIISQPSTSALPTETPTRVATQPPSPTPTSLPAAISGIQTGEKPDDLIQTAQTLKARIHTSLQFSGWFYEHREQISASGTMAHYLLPNGSPRPDHGYTIGWYHLNPSGVVDQFVDGDTDSDGKVLSLSVFSQGSEWISGDQSPRSFQPFQVSDLDNDRLNQMLKFAQANPHQIELIDQDGNPIVRITSTESYDQPMPMDGLAKPITRLVSEDEYDPITGLFLGSQERVVFDDNSDQEIMKIIEEIHLQITPPDAILQIIAAKEAGNYSAIPLNLPVQQL
jgi:hypothetical protein